LKKKLEKRETKVGRFEEKLEAVRSTLEKERVQAKEEVETFCTSV